jgi:hypothetical protein
MAFVTLQEARQSAEQALATHPMTVDEQLRGYGNRPRAQFDIFLSHSTMDKVLILGVVRILAIKGFTVYLDSADPQLRPIVTKHTAMILRLRMRQSRYLFYVHTSNAALSRWCPWELGYFDSLSNPDERVFVMPLVQDHTTPFLGQEYLGLYRRVQVYSPLTANERKEDVTFVPAPG